MRKSLLCSLLVASVLGGNVQAQIFRRAKPAAPAPKGNRFYMTQNGERMTADDFDAWMKARGIRIAKGRQPAAPAPRKPAPKRASSSSR